MNINNFGIFNSDTWGSVGEWVMIFVTIVTIVFLWITFKEQRKANKIQIDKNEVDLIFDLFDRLQTDLEGYLLVEGNKDFFGSTALYKYAKGIANQKNKIDAYNFYKGNLETDNIIYLIRSMNVIASLIDNASFNDNSKTMFKAKLRLFFKLKLEFPLSLIVKSFLLINEDMAIELRQFYNSFAEVPLTKERLKTETLY